MMTKIRRRQSAESQVPHRFPAANAAGQTHSYKVSYDPLTGKFDLWRDGANLGAWTDAAAPLAAGGYISLRTDASEVLFDNIMVTRESKYYEAGGQRHNTSTAVNYLLTDHPSTALRTSLGSTAITTDQSGARLTELRYYAYGGVRYNPGSQVTTDPSLHSGLHQPADGGRRGCAEPGGRVGSGVFNNLPSPTLYAKLFWLYFNPFQDVV